MRLTVAVMILMIAGCVSGRKTDPALVGTWEDTFMKLETKDNPDDYFYADSTHWGRQTGMLPVRRTFHNDGTFSADYRNLQDSVYAVATGTWSVNGDSLYYNQWAPDTFIAAYQYKVKQDTLFLQGLVDWERDGNRNDEFYGTQKKIK